MAHARGGVFGPKACKAAAAGGHLEALKWMYESGCSLAPGRVAIAAVRGGHLPVVEWLIGAFPGAWDAKLSRELPRQAAKHGRVHILEWMKGAVIETTSGETIGFGLEECTWEAGSMDQANVLRWLRENGFLSKAMLCRRCWPGGATWSC